MAGAAVAAFAIVLAFAITDLLTPDSSDMSEAVIPVVMFGPLAVGIALMAGRSSSTRYAFGWGVLIGWPLGLIVTSGLCISGAITPFRIAG